MIVPAPSSRSAVTTKTWNFAAHPTVRPFRFPLFLLLIHLPLGLMCYQSRSLAALHAFGSLAVGVYFALRPDLSFAWPTAVIFYIAGSEVLWRMSRAEVFWEFGKYAIAMIMLAALFSRKKFRVPTAPLLYFALLIPACIATLLESGIADAKDKLSFNMSGPFLLFISAFFFTNASLTWPELKRSLLGLILPIASIGGVAMFYTVTLDNIEFGTESNFASSGGFGPNQVSSILGLGVFICGALLLIFRNRIKESLILGALLLFFATQSMLTFSRGGMYNAILAFLVMILAGSTGLKNNLTKLLPLVGAAAVFIVLIFPYMNDFTGGALQERFEDTETTGRMEIIEADLQIWADNPVLGAGVGEARDLREAYFGKAVGAHTEFARVWAEHGALGVLGLVCLFVGTGISLWSNKSPLLMALGIGAVAWSCFFMTNAGMRLAAPALMWGLSFLSIRARLFPPNFKPRPI